MLIEMYIHAIYSWFCIGTILFNRKHECEFITTITIKFDESFRLNTLVFEPPRDKTNKVSVRPAKTQISLGIRLVWSESLLSAWRKLGPLATHWAHSEDSDQTGWMPRLIWVFAGRTVILLVLSWGGSFFTYLDVRTSISISADLRLSSDREPYWLGEGPTAPPSYDPQSWESAD